MDVTLIPETITWREMCETIAEFVKQTKGVEITAREIFEYSPNGELSAIPEWYLMIMQSKQKARR
jgi:hypothetical protein